MTPVIAVFKGQTIKVQHSLSLYDISLFITCLVALMLFVNWCTRCLSTN